MRCIRWRTVRGFAAVMLAASTVAGCSVLPEPATPPSQYRLAPDPAPFSSAPNGPVLMVDVSHAGSGFETTAMRHTGDGLQLASYADGEWVAPPQDMLVDWAVSALGARGVFRAVVRAAESVPAELRLTLQLLELVHHRAGAGSGDVRLRFRAVLVGEDGRVLVSDVITASEAAGGMGAGAMAAAANSAVRDAVDRLTTLVERQVTEPRR
ncbi:membrane integrity-associated transporter subunit PqiC [Ectothiorhodospiraceae bacterium WFHF3C12]|nr:membrane integrity-associated transporter subunit PqiC [Ectothiorhodospiraceae bacterium WFHF3C12]